MMRDGLGPGTMLGYCTNVHAGASYEQTRANLERYAIAVKARVSPDAPMGVGLWLSAKAARELIEQDRLAEFADWLGEKGLVPFTFNGFPHGDFHEPVVKHKVYRPDWRDRTRLDYTLDLVTIQDRLLAAGSEGSISTLPVGWGADIAESSAGVDEAARNLCRLVEHLHRLEEETGRLIHVDLEPEPGCYLDTSEDVVGLYRDQLFRQVDEDKVRRYLRVCYDICHAAVMFEDHAKALRRYAGAGIEIGKVQVSSAVRVDFDRLTQDERKVALEQLQGFAEDRYLHQTVIRRSGDDRIVDSFIDDLPAAITAHDGVAGPAGEWRIHFHVPLFVDRFGLLETTQGHIGELLAEAQSSSQVRHFEAETYAWGVLPQELQMADLSEGIAKELSWLCDQVSIPSATQAS
jgi:sugar phosphate isomerase/epimerase